MTLLELSAESARTTGSGLGFVIKSLAHPGRKFRVCYQFTSGKFGITRLDTGSDYIVEGTSDRYDFVLPVARIRELKLEIDELTEQQAVIETRLAELGEVMDGLTNVG